MIIVRTLVLALLAYLLPLAGHGGEARVAVASNFAHTLAAIAAQFESETNHQIQISFASSGKLYAQILHGAPYDLLLSADQDIPRSLIDKGIGLGESLFTYARGTLVLWSSKAGYLGDGGQVLREGGFNRLAIANPRVAPYGRAASEVLEALGLDQSLQGRLVMGENIAQTYQFVATNNAELGFIALSQTLGQATETQGSMWLVPKELYRPIRQDAVLLSRGRDNAAALAFFDFLQSQRARAIIEDHGYHWEEH